MKKIVGTVLAVLFAILMVLPFVGAIGCSQKPSHPTFHAVSYDPCSRPQVVGTIGNMRFGLNRSVDEKTATTVACPGVGLAPDSIGKDFPAAVDLDHSRVTLSLPVYASPTFDEFKQGKTRGKQTG